MLEMFRQIKNSHSRGCPLILAVIAETRRHTPRGVGSCMLVSEEGLLYGTIGGGPLEGGALSYAAQLLKQKRSEQAAFGRAKNQAVHPADSAEGDILVWMQYIDPDISGWQEICDTAIKQLEEDQNDWFVLKRNGDLPEICAGEPDDPEKDMFSMPLTAGERLLLFGGGHCAKALVPIMKSIGFRVSVFENRPQFAVKERFPQAEQAVLCDYENIAEVVCIRPKDYIVLMTGGHEYDLALLSEIMKHPYAYLGVMASKSCSAQYRKQLEDLGLPAEKLKEMHSPVGLNIHGVTPEEIAVSVAAEIISVRAERRKQ